MFPMRLYSFCNCENLVSLSNNWEQQQHVVLDYIDTFSVFKFQTQLVNVIMNFD